MPVPFLFGDRAGAVTGIERNQLDADFASLSAVSISAASFPWLIRGDGVTDFTVQMQAFLDYLNNPSISVNYGYIPAGTGEILISAPLSLTWSGKPIGIGGDQGVTTINTQGTTFRYSGAGAMFTYNGASTNGGFLVEKLKLRASDAATLRIGIKIASSYGARVSQCVFEGFAFATGTQRGSGLWIGATAGNVSVDCTVRGCSFNGNYSGVYADKVNSNNLGFYSNVFNSNSYGIRGGDFSGVTAFSFLNWNVSEANDFNANALADIATIGGGQGLYIGGNYFESPAASSRSPLQLLVTGGITGTNGSLVIEANTFSGPLPAAATGHIVLMSWVGVNIGPNFCATAPQTGIAFVQCTDALTSAFTIGKPAGPSAAVMPIPLIYGGRSFDGANVTDIPPLLKTGVAFISSGTGPYTFRAGEDVEYQFIFGALVGTVTITLANVIAGPLQVGTRFKIARYTSATGAFNVTIQNAAATLIINLTAAGKFAEIVWDGANWSTFASN